MTADNSHAITLTRSANRRDALLLSGLTLFVVAITGVMLWHGLTTWIEAAGFVTGALCVVMVVRQNVWNFPVGMTNNVVFFVLFCQTKLYGDAGLQVAFFILGGIGWYLWLFGGTDRTPLRVTSAPPGRRVGVGAAVFVMWAILVPTLHFTGGSAPVFDGLIAAMSLGAQWLTDRKNWECWLLSI